jgi:hypothetical protein
MHCSQYCYALIVTSLSPGKIETFQQQVRNGHQLVSSDRQTIDEGENVREMMPKFNENNAF